MALLFPEIISAPLNAKLTYPVCDPIWKAKSQNTYKIMHAFACEF